MRDWQRQSTIQKAVTLKLKAIFRGLILYCRGPIRSSKLSSAPPNSNFIFSCFYLNSNQSEQQQKGKRVKSQRQSWSYKKVFCPLAVSYVMLCAFVVGGKLVHASVPRYGRCNDGGWHTPHARWSHWKSGTTELHSLRSVSRWKCHLRNKRIFVYIYIYFTGSFFFSLFSSINPM